MLSGASILKLLSSLSNLFLRQEFFSILGGRDRRENCAKHVRHTSGTEEVRQSYTSYQFLMQPVGLYRSVISHAASIAAAVTCVNNRAERILSE